LHKNFNKICIITSNESELLIIELSHKTKKTIEIIMKAGRNASWTSFGGGGSIKTEIMRR